MSKKILLSLSFVFSLTFILLNPQSIKAAAITDIGDLNISESKTVTISGLDAGRKYYWKESKVTSTIPIRGYSNVFTDCYIADGNGEIQKNVGPFPTPGFYKLEIYRTNNNTSGKCESVALPVTNPKEFSVGGPVNMPKGQSCCEGSLIIYDRGRNVCKKDPIDILPLIRSINPINNPLQLLEKSQEPTKCQASGTYCEPESLQCFTAKILTSGGKICKDPTDPDFDKDKHTICGLGEGIPCGNDPKNLGISTAIGCIHTSPAGFIEDLLKFIIGISGGLAFLMMLLGAFQMITSAGNPETLQAGRDRFQSAIIGLLFVIFAVLLLKIIGVDILGLGQQFGEP